MIHSAQGALRTASGRYSRLAHEDSDETSRSYSALVAELLYVFDNRAAPTAENLGHSVAHAFIHQVRGQFVAFQLPSK